MKALINEQTPIIIGSYLSSEFGKRDNFGLIAYREHDVDCPKMPRNACCWVFG